MPETWTIQKLLDWTTDHFQKNKIESARLETEILLAHALSLKRIDLYAKHDQIIQADKLAAFKASIQRRLKNEPTAYIVGFQPFLGLDFEVNKSVLIPRPETEQLVELAIDTLKKRIENREQRIEILDIGTGSGCIAISLAKYLANAQVTGIDISEQALDIARRNAQKHGVSDRCDFILQDARTAFMGVRSPAPPLDLIISNPPYIPTADIATLESNVKDWEPKQALDGGTDGLDYIKQLFSFVPKRLNSNGLFMLEFGFNQAEPIRQLAKGIFRKIEIKIDLAGKERFFIGRL